MNGLKLYVGIVSMCVTFPLWLYVMYSLLKAADVNETAWLAFWVYLPVSILLGLAARVIDAKEDKK